MGAMYSGIDSSRQAFEFLDPGPLVDSDLELIVPSEAEVPAVLAACRHPTTLAIAPEMSRITRQTLVDFLAAAPRGRHSGDPALRRCPSYHFWMRLADPAPVRIAGGVGLRIGDDPNLLLYIGHIGYNVYPPARGHRLAERASRLLLPLARRHGMKQLWITCNPQNFASRRTCERLGAKMVEIVSLPSTHELYARGEREKCRYCLDL